MERSLETVFATHQSSTASNSSISSGLTSVSATCVNKDGQEKRLQDTRSLFVVHPFSWSKVHLTEYDDSCTTVNGQIICRPTSENTLINDTGSSPKMFSPRKDNQVEFGVSLQQYPGVGVSEEPMITRSRSDVNGSLRVSDSLMTQLPLCQDNELADADALELQNHERYFLTPLNTDVESNPDDTEHALGLDWESLVLYEKDNYKNDLDSYVDDYDNNPQHDNDDCKNNNVSNVSISTIESWSECSFQGSLLPEDCENINFAESQLSLDEFRSRSTHSGSLGHRPGCTAVSFVSLHDLFRPYRAEPEEYDANTGNLSPENENLGDVAMCSLDSIDKVLAVQNENPNLFEQMREICMKRFTCFGIDNLSKSLSTFHVNAAKGVNKETNSRTINNRTNNSNNFDANVVSDEINSVSWKAIASFQNREVSYQSTLTPTPSSVHNIPSKEMHKHASVDESYAKNLTKKLEESLVRGKPMNKKKTKLNITRLARQFIKFNNPKFWIPQLRRTKLNKSNAIFKLFQQIRKKIQNLKRK